MSQFDVFLCHNSLDKPAVKRIAESLKELGIRPWLDEWELRPGIPWQRALEQEIESISSAAVFVGEEGVGPWQQMELDAFLRKFVERGLPVIPVLLPDAPNKPALPLFISGMTYVDFRVAEPNPIDRLIWGVTGKKPPISAKRKLRSSTSRLQPVVSDEIISNCIGMKLVRIPAGEFLMGSPDDDEMAESDEKPQHPVRITKPFYLGVYPVTQKEYEKVMGTNPSEYRHGGRYPVDGVSWFDAVDFCNRLSEQEGHSPCYEIHDERVRKINDTGYRLPTEAEWEYACRAGSTTIWTFGDDFGDKPSELRRYVWCSPGIEDEDADHWKEATQPVGKMEPNPWGLYDMCGNIREWCQDWYGKRYYKNSPVADPIGPSRGVSGRVTRGGCFGDDASRVRSACRFSILPIYNMWDTGFRVARTYF